MIWTLLGALGRGAAVDVSTYLGAQSPNTATSLVATGLTAEIPVQIADFTQVTTLEFTQGSISGTVPSLAALPLISLSLNENALSGDLSFLGNVTTLVTLSLAFNNFDGAFPDSILEMTDLTKLDLSFNKLSGAIPDLDVLSGLTVLDLSGNMFTSPFHELVFPVSLQELYLGMSSLSGTIPVTISLLTSLEYLYVWEADLYGTIPPALGTMTSLLVVDLSSNTLSGSIPASIAGLTDLHDLILNGNFLGGTYPAGANLPTLERLNLADNCLHGPLPPLDLPSVILVNVSYNCFSGTVPQIVGSLPNLVDLVLTQNNLVGTLPTFEGATSLASLEVKNNLFTGPAPTLAGVAVDFAQRTTLAPPKFRCPEFITTTPPPPTTTVDVLGTTTTATTATTATTTTTTTTTIATTTATTATTTATGTTAKSGTSTSMSTTVSVGTNTPASVNTGNPTTGTPKTTATAKQTGGASSSKSELLLLVLALIPIFY